MMQIYNNILDKKVMYEVLYNKVPQYLHINPDDLKALIIELSPYLTNNDKRNVNNKIIYGLMIIEDEEVSVGNYYVSYLKEEVFDGW